MNEFLFFTMCFLAGYHLGMENYKLGIVCVIVSIALLGAK